MNTQCPHCQTLFRIDQAQIDAAGGRVRCSECRRVFDARARLQSELPLDGAASEPAPGQRAGLGLDEPGAGTAGTVSGVLLSDLGSTSPVRTRRSPAVLAGWAVFNLLLLLVLVSQLVFVQRDVFAQQPRLRPLLEPMCQLAGCQLAPLRAIDRIELVRRDVYQHPSREDALLIDATMVNNAGFSQPYPMFTVGLGDRLGRVMSRSSFAPEEYLDQYTPGARIV
ncbi:MAG: DUF3426 domain-containing protein, partial [Halofilum sp. (in: g-proteobacteria)]